MTRVHFIQLAKMIDDNTLVNDSECINKDTFIKHLTEYCSLVNDRFNKDKFINACNFSSYHCLK